LSTAARSSAITS